MIKINLDKDIFEKFCSDYLNHEECWGGIWRCPKCKRTFCYANGSDDPTCDECSVKESENGRPEQGQGR